MKRWSSAVLLLATIACVGRQSQQPVSPPPPSESPETREKGLLLLLADRRVYDPFTVATVQKNDALHADLAVALGRVGDDRGRMALQTLLADRRPQVRRSAAFSLGQLADPASSSYLLRAVRDSDTETGIWAVAALAALEVDLATVVEAGESLRPGERWQRLLPYLFRFPAAQIYPVAEQALHLDNSDLRAMAVYALARNPDPRTAPLLRACLTDAHPQVRGWAARALGQVGDSRSGPAIQAMRAAQQLIANGLAAAPASWRPLLLRLFDDPRPGVALTALASSSAWLLDDELGDALQARLESGSSRQRQVALQALVRGKDPRARDLSTRFATDPDPHLRASAAEAATWQNDSEILEFLSLDESPLVRVAALAGLLSADGEGTAEQSREALSDPDPAVRATTAEWLIEHPVVPVEDLSRAMIGPGEREVVELRLFGTRALVARGIAEPLERGLAVQNLETLARVGEYPGRREAAAGLEELNRPRPSIGPAGTKKSAQAYIQIVKQTESSQSVEIHTTYGKMELLLDCPATPMTCLSFLQLARQGYFDGQIFHRVVPDFVVQTGDPRGDGWGGPGYTLRDELNRQPFVRGVVGMASSGPDTAGSQFFVVLSPQPHLDGRYTAFGRVVSGEEILDEIVQGDRLERVVVVR
jgi:cyclophilin family peptidyl-prolyl cis-trans isomerase/HEAT repeat protein